MTDQLERASDITSDWFASLPASMHKDLLKGQHTTDLRDAIAQALSDAEDRVWERAINECHEVRDSYSSSDRDDMARRIGASDCAHAIRALKNRKEG